jgi:cysteinyl-tRNA synthetase
MIIHKLIRRGTDHKNYAEDSLACKELENFIYACVFDGCSKGVESHFASTLFAKAFNDTLNELNQLFDNSTTSLESQAKMLLFQMARKVREVKGILNLNIIELMSTIVLCVVDKNTKSCYVVAIGDGYYRVDKVESFIQNTKFIEQEHSENKPDYIAYDLDKIQNYLDFELWFSQKPERHLFENVTDITISSDGMNTFSEFKNSKDRTDPIAFLVRDEEMLENKIMLDKKYNILQSMYGVINKDDLGMVRIKLD